MEQNKTQDQYVHVRNKNMHEGPNPFDNFKFKEKNRKKCSAYQKTSVVI